MGSMLAEWPTAKDLYGNIRELPKLCKQVTRKPAIELVIEMLTNAPERLKDQAWGDKHDLVVAINVERKAAVVCKRCGCRAAQRAVGLKRQCEGKPKSGNTQSVLVRLRAGRHPVTDLPLDRLERLYSSD